MKKLVVVTVVLAGLLVVPSAGAKGKNLLVGNEAVEWTSPEKYARDVPMNVRIRVNGNEILGTAVRKDCVIDYAGRGVVVRVNGCDNGQKASPIRVRIASARERRVWVKVTYWR